MLDRNQYALQCRKPQLSTLLQTNWQKLIAKVFKESTFRPWNSKGWQTYLLVLNMNYLLPELKDVCNLRNILYFPSDKLFQPGRWLFGKYLQSFVKISRVKSRAFFILKNHMFTKRLQSNKVRKFSKGFQPLRTSHRVNISYPDARVESRGLTIRIKVNRQRKRIWLPFQIIWVSGDISSWLLMKILENLWPSCQFDLRLFCLRE